jgi:hypothetical protein
LQALGTGAVAAVRGNHSQKSTTTRNHRGRLYGPKSGFQRSFPEGQELQVICNVIDYNGLAKAEGAPASTVIALFHRSEALQKPQTKPTMSRNLHVALFPVDQLKIAHRLLRDDERLFQR